MEFKMTFKKINKKSQVIIEYFLLTAAVLALTTLTLFYTQSTTFTNNDPAHPGIREICAAATNRAVLSISGVTEGNTITP